MTLGADVSGVVHAFRRGEHLYPICADLAWIPPVSYATKVLIKETRFANLSLPGQSITCLWCTLAVMRAHA